ncbi:MAG: TetR/AcrR family transcriptional regulator [Methanobacteriaceae archaeon]|nr:TetR/AcrR family transcriptional regulator [Methanobacteriaceae archaeon]MDP2835630.1 TetR/AcrR family transcriptional regulator [Methanobacteriaceae archaeon]MDP3033771.1 TetR/AcrR family transcriptional regulator [Methanobacteriaceae archaeon]
MDNTEDRILDATIKLLDEVGWDGATTKKIAAEAGVNEVTLFRKFKTKNLLLEAAKNRGAINFLEELEELLKIDPESDIQTYLRTIWKNSSNMIDKRTNLIRIAMEEVRGVSFENKVLPKISKMVLDNLTVYFKYQIAKGSIRNIDPEVAALNFFSIVFQMNMMWKIYGQNPLVEDERCLENFLDIFMNGILVNK